MFEWARILHPLCHLLLNFYKPFHAHILNNLPIIGPTALHTSFCEAPKIKSFLNHHGCTFVIQHNPHATFYECIRSYAVSPPASHDASAQQWVRRILGSQKWLRSHYHIATKKKMHPNTCVSSIQGVGRDSSTQYKANFSEMRDGFDIRPAQW